MTKNIEQLIESGITKIVARVLRESNDAELIDTIAHNLWPGHTLNPQSKKREVDKFIKTYFPNKSYQFVSRELQSNDDNPEPRQI